MISRNPWRKMEIVLLTAAYQHLYFVGTRGIITITSYLSPVRHAVGHHDRNLFTTIGRGGVQSLSRSVCRRRGKSKQRVREMHDAEGGGDCDFC